MRFAVSLVGVTVLDSHPFALANARLLPHFERCIDPIMLLLTLTHPLITRSLPAHAFSVRLKPVLEDAMNTSFVGSDSLSMPHIRFHHTHAQAHTGIPFSA